MLVGITGRRMTGRHRCIGTASSNNNSNTQLVTGHMSMRKYSGNWSMQTL